MPRMTVLLAVTGGGGISAPMETVEKGVAQRLGASVVFARKGQRTRAGLGRMTSEANSGAMLACLPHQSENQAPHSYAVKSGLRAAPGALREEVGIARQGER